MFKKKFFIFLLVIIFSFGLLCGCDGNEQSSSPSSQVDVSDQNGADPDNYATYTITFRQDGYEDVVRTIKIGEKISQTDIPVVHQKTGYSVSWKVFDINNTTDNIIVLAEEVPNKYTITIVADPSKYTCSSTKIEVEYNSTPTMPNVQMVDSNYKISYWRVTSKGTVFNAKKVYSYDYDITIEPVLVVNENWSPSC